MTNGKHPSVPVLDQEEYRMVFGLMGERDAFIRTTYLFSVSAVGALSWAVISLYLDHQKGANIRDMMWWLAYLPALACLPLLFVMAAQRRDLIRAGAYIRVFFEDRVDREGWQGRKGQFRLKGESNDPIITFYFVVLFLCFWVNRQLHVYLSYGEGALIAVVAGLLLWGRRNWRFAAEGFRQECIRQWESVLRKERL